MKIVVLVKQVPDTYGERKLSLETALAERTEDGSVLDEVTERALEVALSYADRTPDTEIVVMSMGPAAAQGAIRKGLAMGAQSAVHIVDDELRGADARTTADTVAAALRKVGFDLVIAGGSSTDGGGGVLPVWVSELLDVPAATSLSRVDITPDAVSGTRITELAEVEISASLPAVISITEALPDARFPNFKGIMAAKKKPLETWTLADLGPGAVALEGRSIATAVNEKPARAAGQKIVDEGDAGERLGEFLVQNRLV